MTQTATVQIVGSYSECCFCPRPTLAPLRGVPYRPRLLFARAAQDWAASCGATWGGLNKYKSAWATLPHACSHRLSQLIRIDWELEYGP